MRCVECFTFFDQLTTDEHLDVKSPWQITVQPIHCDACILRAIDNFENCKSFILLVIIIYEFIQQSKPSLTRPEVEIATADHVQQVWKMPKNISDWESSILSEKSKSRKPNHWMLFAITAPTIPFLAHDTSGRNEAAAHVHRVRSVRVTKVPS